MVNFPLKRNGLPVAAGYHRLSFNGLIDKAGPLIDTPDEFQAVNAVHQYIDTQRGRSKASQAQQFVLRATIESIDFGAIQ